MIAIVSAEGEIHSGEASMVYAPAQMGEVGIAPRHAPLLTALKPGEVRVQDVDGKEHFFYIIINKVTQSFKCGEEKNKKKAQQTQRVGDSGPNTQKNRRNTSAERFGANGSR